MVGAVAAVVVLAVATTDRFLSRRHERSGHGGETPPRSCGRRESLSPIPHRRRVRRLRQPAAATLTTPPLSMSVLAEFTLT